MLLFSSMPKSDGSWLAKGSIPLFADALANGKPADIGGFILSPTAFAPVPFDASGGNAGGGSGAGSGGGVLCGYPYDPHTFNYVCEPPGLSASCIPGCCCGGSASAPAWVKGFIGAQHIIIISLSHPLLTSASLYILLF